MCYRSRLYRLGSHLDYPHLWFHWTTPKEVVVSCRVLGEGGVKYSVTPVREIVSPSEINFLRELHIFILFVCIM